MRRLLKRIVEKALPDSVRFRLQTQFAGSNFTAPLSAANEINRREARFCSQNGEDGMIAYVFSLIGVRHRTFVEFGFHPQECNCAYLVRAKRFAGLFIDGSTKTCDEARRFYQPYPGVKITNAFVQRDNINDLISEAGFAGEIDLLSVDIDGVDYWVWEAINVVSPRLVVVEYNASLGAEWSVTVPYDPKFIRHEKHPSGIYCGASLAALTKFGIKRGYRLIGCDSQGINAFFLHNDISAPMLPTLSPQEAFFPHHLRRENGMSEAAQFDLLKGMEFIQV